MAITDRNTLKEWFESQDKPTQAQFWSLIDSIRLVSEKVPVGDISGLTELLSAKVDKKDIQLPEVYDPAQNYVFAEETQQYVSYRNELSENDQFKSEGFYRLVEDAPAGESPETHPAHWSFQGVVWGEITIDDIVGLAGELEALRNSSGSGGGSAYLLNVAEVPTYNADGSVRIIKQSYVADPAKYFEQRFEYTNGFVSKIEKKDDMIETWVQETGLFDVNGQLLKPTIVDITDWTIL